MQCPQCNQKTIGFFRWCWSVNAFIWRCPNCESSLKGNNATWMWFGLAVVAIVIAGGALVYHEQVHGSGIGRYYVFGSMLVLIPPFSYASYKFGGYRLREGAP